MSAHRGRINIFIQRVRGFPLGLLRRAKSAGHNIIIFLYQMPELSRLIDRLGEVKIPPRPIRFCIYCGASGPDVKLQREHVFPYALGGRFSLLEASCAACADVTKKFEEYCADNIFNDVRVHHGTQSRRPQARQLKIPEFGDNLLIPVLDHPGLMMLPRFRHPYLITGDDPSAGFYIESQYWFTHRESKQRAAQLFRRGLKQGKGKRKMKLHELGRQILKIGYCEAIATYGLSYFKPLGIDTIMGRDSSGPYWVGSWGWEETVPHYCWRQVGILKHKKRKYVFVRLRFFAFLPTPVYLAIVGEVVPTRKRFLRWARIRLLRRMPDKIPSLVQESLPNSARL